MRRRDRGQDGAVVVEFAIVFVLFAMLVWGIITYGVVFAVQQTVTHAAAEAARATVGQPDPDTAKDIALGVALDQLSWLGVSGEPDRDDVVFAACEPPATGQTCVHVTYTYPWADNPIVTPLFRVGVPSVIRGEAVVIWEGL